MKQTRYTVTFSNGAWFSVDAFSIIGAAIKASCQQLDIGGSVEIETICNEDSGISTNAWDGLILKPRATKEVEEK